MRWTEGGTGLLATQSSWWCIYIQFLLIFGFILNSNRWDPSKILNWYRYWIEQLRANINYLPFYLRQFPLKAVLQAKYFEPLVKELKDCLCFSNVLIICTLHRMQKIISHQRYLVNMVINLISHIDSYPILFKVTQVMHCAHCKWGPCSQALRACTDTNLGLQVGSSCLMVCQRALLVVVCHQNALLHIESCYQLFTPCHAVPMMAGLIALLSS